MRSARPRKRRRRGRRARPEARVVVAHASDGGACTVAMTGIRRDEPRRAERRAASATGDAQSFAVIRAATGSSRR